MRFLLLNQTFHPDVMATGQYLTEVALRLAERGHEVTVVTSRRAYDDPEMQFPREETWRGIRIIRVGSTGFGKGTRWKRVADFGSFLALCALRLAFLRRQDAVVALTSPPFIGFLGACLPKLRGSRFFYWVMDFNPDEAIAAGWLRSGSRSARALEWVSRFSLRRAVRIIALDRFMRDRIVAKGFPPHKIIVLPPWSNDSEVRFDPKDRERFRKTHGLDGKFVVMYSGNHSPCHPLETLLDAARRLTEEPKIVFCFIGGGSEWRKIRDQVAKEKNGKESARNIVCLPYRPLSQLSASLSSADLHVVVLGEPFVGLVHPCKIYNILRIGAPLLYIGPQPSHITEVLQDLKGEHTWATAAHGDVESVIKQIKNACRESAVLDRHVPHHAPSNFSKEAILPRLIKELESV